MSRARLALIGHSSFHRGFVPSLRESVRASGSSGHCGSDKSIPGALASRFRSLHSSFSANDFRTTPCESPLVPVVIVSLLKNTMNQNELHTRLITYDGMFNFRRRSLQSGNSRFALHLRDEHSIDVHAHLSSGRDHGLLGTLHADCIAVSSTPNRVQEFLNPGLLES
ncbi:hypothetical protein OG21DRAFT_270424 [Imleria badia]|nr:hypothetical protein OG21DRAFT_270424 [Imleria badia]